MRRGAATLRARYGTSIIARMPFTISHVTAMLPLRAPMGRFAVPSALAIGTMAPDFIYFHWGFEPRDLTHTLPALFWYCLPTGLLAYVVWHWILKRPLLALAPVAVERRLRRVVAAPVPMNIAHWIAVSISIVVGGATHLFWDGFTHAQDFGVRAFPVLASEPVAFGGYRIALYKLLQHGSSVVGLLIILAWGLIALRRLEPAVIADAQPVRATRRGGIAAALLIVPALIGVAAGLQALRGAQIGRVMPLELFVSTAVVVSIAAFCLAIFAYGVWWQVRARRQS